MLGVVLTMFGSTWFPQQGLQVTPYQNPVYPFDAPDPSGVVQGDDGYYYVVTTQSVHQGALRYLPIFKSKDLVKWQYAGDVFKQIPSWQSTTNVSMWAPDFIKHEGKYYVYYSGKVRNPDSISDMAIGVAVADHPLGPYVDKGSPVASGPSFTTIDPHIYTDTDGTRYMFWGSGFEPIKAQKLSDDGMSLIGSIHYVLPVHPGKKYEPLLEAPWVIKRGPWYYLFVSGNNCCGDNANYATIVARSTSVLGPYQKYWQYDSEMKPLLEQNINFRAPGHNSIITDAVGQQWIFYHAFDRSQPGRGRVLMMDKISWSNGWPVINEGKGPTAARQKDGPITRSP